MQEADLFDYLVGCCYPDLLKAKKQMSRWDCYSPDTGHRIELKCRSVHYDTLILERKKYDALIEKAYDNFDIPMYINYTPKGIYRFNLLKIEPIWVVKYLKKTTNFSENNRIPKEIALLPVIDADIL